MRILNLLEFVCPTSGSKPAFQVFGYTLFLGVPK